MIGLELLGNRAVAAVVDQAGRVTARADSGPSSDLKTAAFAALAGLPATESAGLSIASVDPDSTESIAATKALAGKHRGPLLHDPPISSGTAAAAAENWIGAARGASDVVFFGVSEHASAGFIRNGTPFAGAHRRGPAIAWLALNPVEREDYRKIGCLEAEVAAAGIVRRLIWRIKAGDHSRVQEAVDGDLTAIGVDHVLAAARDGDGVAISVIRDTAKYLGMAGANLVVIADPEVLVLGGFMAVDADLLLEPVRTEIARRLPQSILETLTIAPAALGAGGPAIGAVRLAAAALP
jgi:glucokinase